MSCCRDNWNFFFHQLGKVNIYSLQVKFSLIYLCLLEGKGNKYLKFVIHFKIWTFVINLLRKVGIDKRFKCSVR